MNESSLESMISLGDSGSPLLIKDDQMYFLIGVASWVKKGLDQNRGYGSSAGFSSIEQNSLWINDNNPLRYISSISDGIWSQNSNWDEIKKDMVIAFKDKDGKLTEKVPGKYESIKIISITNDRYKIKDA